MSKPSPLVRGAYYHVYNRGDNREDIFIEAQNYAYFLGLYAKYVGPVADTFAHCLLRNHFHLLVRIKADQSDPKGLEDPSGLPAPHHAFGNCFNAYAKAISKRYGRTGSLFQHPFSRIPVTSDTYFVQLIHYIHFNPQKHGLASDFREYPYSSYRELCTSDATGLKREEVLSWFGGTERFAQSHLQMGDQEIARFTGDD